MYLFLFLTYRLLHHAMLLRWSSEGEGWKGWTITMKRLCCVLIRVLQF